MMVEIQVLGDNAAQELQDLVTLPSVEDERFGRVSAQQPAVAAGQTRARNCYWLAAG